MSRVPFLMGFPEASSRWSWLLFGLLLASIAATVAGIVWRAALGLSLALLTVLVLRDQHRSTPCVYQFLIVGGLLATLSRVQKVVFARWWLIALYLHSGLSKLDASFCRELGLTFLTMADCPFGLNPEAGPASWQVAAVLSMPAWEIAVAAALLLPRTRRLGLVGAVVLHTGLVIILVPWGLRHSKIVLVWNAAMLVEVGLLFGSDLAEHADSSERGTWLAPLTWVVFWIAVALPLSERRGWSDDWPAHALYASHVERTVVYRHENQLDSLDPKAGRHVLVAYPGSGST